MSNTTSEPNRIERDLDQTRSRLGEHLSELQGRLSPGQVIDDLMRYFRGREGADFGRSLLTNVRANPLPVALTGIGLTWLMASSPRQGTTATPAPGGNSRVRIYSGAPASSNHVSDDTIEKRMRAAEQSVTREDDESEHVYADRLNAARGQTVGLTRHAQETTASFSDRIRDALTGAKQTIVDGVHDLRGGAGDKAGSVGATVQGAAQSVSNTAQGAVQWTGGALTQSGQAVSQAGSSLIGALTENPVFLGALGLAAGAVLGALLPQSDQEEAALDKVAGQTRDAASGLAQEAVNRGSHVTKAVMQAGRNRVHAQGLDSGNSAGSLVDAALSGDLTDNLKQVAADVLQTGDEAIRKEVPGQAKDAARRK